MTVPAHRIPTQPRVAVDSVLGMSRARLNELFSVSEAGPIPVGRGRGTVVFATGTFLAGIVARLTYALVWRGKVFDAERDELLNIVSPLGVMAIRARVYKDSSWVDGRECTVLDYSNTSKVAHWIRDEIREVAPGVFLGQVFWSKAKLLKFVLVFTRP